MIWFFLLICIPQRWLLPAIIIAIIVAPLYRIFGVSIGMGPRSINQMLPGNIDFLAVGGLIAYAEIRDFALFADSSSSSGTHSPFSSRSAARSACWLFATERRRSRFLRFLWR